MTPRSWAPWVAGRKERAEINRIARDRVEFHETRRRIALAEMETWDNVVQPLPAPQPKRTWLGGLFG